MSELKEGWKEAGKGVGNAFKTFGKTVAKSARTIVVPDGKKDNSNKENKEPETVDVKEVNATEDKTEVSVNETEVVDHPKKNGSNVFNDGSWREVGRGFGRGFGNMGKMVGKTLSNPFRRKKKAKNKKSKEKPTSETDIKKLK